MREGGLFLRSRSRKIDKDTIRGQGHMYILPKYEDNRSSGYGGVRGQTHRYTHTERDTQSRLQQYTIDSP